MHFCLYSRDGDDVDQHVFTILKQHGRAAIVLPDNRSLRGRRRRNSSSRTAQASRRSYVAPPADRHPHAQGVKANVLSFDRKPAAEKP
jgi:type I restriction enzyme M protein